MRKKKVKKTVEKGENIKNILGKNVRYYRYQNKLTQEKLAERSDLSPRYVSDIENGNGNVPVETLYKLALVLKVKPYQLVKKRNLKSLPKKVNMKIDLSQQKKVDTEEKK